MPRFAPLGIVSVAALSVVIVACTRTSTSTNSVRDPWATPPITVDIKCEPGVSVGMTDATGKQAWSVDVKPKDDIEWRVGNNITDVKILSKTADPLPLVNPTPEGNGRGKPATSKVKDDAKSGHYPYKIEATCIRADQSTIKVTLDPDIIVW